MPRATPGLDESELIRRKGRRVRDIRTRPGTFPGGPKKEYLRPARGTRGDHPPEGGSTRSPLALGAPGLMAAISPVAQVRREVVKVQFARGELSGLPAGKNCSRTSCGRAYGEARMGVLFCVRTHRALG